MTTKQSYLFDEIIKGLSFDEACQKLGLSKRVGLKYFNDVEFQNEIVKQKDKQIKNVIDVSEFNLNIVFNELIAIIKSEKCTDDLKVNAINVFLSGYNALKENYDLSLRVCNLENIICNEYKNIKG